MSRRRTNGEPWGCLHLPRKAGGVKRSEEISDVVGAGTGPEVDGVVDEVGVDAGVECGGGSEDVGSIGVGAEASCSAKSKMSEPCSGKSGRGRGRC